MSVQPPSGAPSGAPPASGGQQLPIVVGAPSASFDDEIVRVREYVRSGLAIGLLVLLAIEAIMLIVAGVWICRDINTIKDMVAVIFVPTLAIASAATAFYFAGDDH